MAVVRKAVALAELHCHVQLDGRQPFSRWRLMKLLNRADRLGLDWLAVTEHLDARAFWPIFDFLQQVGWRWRRVRVLAGFELTVREGADILIIGPPSEVAGLGRRWQPAKHPGGAPDLAGMLAASAGGRLLRIGAHPYRPGRRLADLPAELLTRLDAIELNRGELPQASAVRRLATSLARPLVGGSDAHWQQHLGRLLNELPGGIKDWDGLRQAIAAGQARVVRRVRPARSGGSARLIPLFPPAAAGIPDQPAAYRVTSS